MNGMNVAWFIALWVAIGLGVLFVALSGGPGRARRNYLTRGNRGVRWGMTAAYIVLGIAIPGTIIASSGAAVGGTGALVNVSADAEMAHGRHLFRTHCGACHAMAAVNTHGVTGPDLDEIAPLDRDRVRNAIRHGGTGQNRMPENILRGDDAEAVAIYVERVAGRPQ